MPSGRVCEPLNVTAEERQKLENWVRRPKTAQRLAWRARIILSCAEGNQNQDVAQQLGLDVHTVGKWRERFRLGRLEGLADEPRPGAPRRISDAQVEAVITRTLETRPAQGTHWSTRSLAQEMGLSQTAVSRIWRAFALQRIVSNPLSSQPTRSLSKRCATLWVCISIRQIGRSCCV